MKIFPRKCRKRQHEGTVYHRMDIIWHHISSTKAADGSLCFPQLSCVAKLVLVIPHSNAQEERMFSMVRNKTAFQPSLDPKGTLSSILTIKLANNQPSHNFESAKEMQQKAKVRNLGVQQNALNK